MCRDQNIEAKLMPPFQTARPLGTWPASHVLGIQQKCTFCAFVNENLSVEKDLVRSWMWWRAARIYVYCVLFDKEPGCRLRIEVGVFPCRLDPSTGLSTRVPMETQAFEPRGSLVSTRLLPVQAMAENPLPGASTQLSTPITGRVLAATVDWRLVRGWLMHCHSHHSHHGRRDLFQGKMGSGVTSEAIPWASCFRLIDVRNKCIIEAALLFRYAALSYVWGGCDPLRLTSRNKAQFTSPGGLEIGATLPKTFQDAMTVVQNLGIDYLWTDALCIQHDDDKDLGHQINSMDKIYQEAMITIVSLVPNAGCAMPGVGPDTRSTSEIRFTGKSLDLMYTRPILDNVLGRSVWETRGWTLQEKFFSKRLLFFTPYQVYYQCPDALWAEDCVLEPPGFQDVSDMMRKRSSDVAVEEPDIYAVPPESSNRPPPALGHNPWDEGDWTLASFFVYEDLLTEYMKRSLTRDADILAAFSGILNGLETWLGPSVFGMPERIFDIALLWYGKTIAERRPEFPSWSWCGWRFKQDRAIR